LLYLPIADASTQLPGVSVADPAKGKTLATIDMSTVESLRPLAASGRAIATTAEDEFFLIDPATETATQLEIAPDVGAIFEWKLGFRANAGKRYTPLSDGRDVFLLEIATGTVTKLGALLPEDSPPILLGPVLSSDEEMLIIWDSVRQWILPTSDPASIRSLTPEGVGSQAASSSPDGQFIIYSRWTSTADQTPQVVIEPIDGSGEPKVITTGEIVSGVFIGGPDRIAFVHYGETAEGHTAETVLFDRTTGEERSLYASELNPTVLFPAGSETQLVPLTADSSQLVGYPTFSANSQSAIAAMFGPDEQMLMVFDLPGARVEIVRNGPFGGATISPDGCRFVVGDRDPVGGDAPIITIDTIELDDEVGVGPGLSPIWVSA
jgi:hypothetical protein